MSDVAPPHELLRAPADRPAGKRGARGFVAAVAALSSLVPMVFFSNAGDSAWARPGIAAGSLALIAGAVLLWTARRRLVVAVAVVAVAAGGTLGWLAVASELSTESRERREADRWAGAAVSFIRARGAIVTKGKADAVPKGLTRAALIARLGEPSARGVQRISRRARPPLPGVQAHRRKGVRSNADRLLLQGRPLRGARRVVTRGRLRRRTEHRLAAGVAGGIADRLNASVGFVRVILFLAIVWVPWSLEAYAVAALLIPPRGADRPDWDNLIGLARLGVLFGVPVLALAGGINIGDSFDGPVGWWVAYLGLLAAGAVALLGADYRRERPRTRAEARAVVLATLPVAICAAGFAAAVWLAPDVRWERAAPAVALVGAVTVVIATWRDRVGTVLPPAILAVAIVGLIAAADARLEGGVGDERVVPEPADGRPVVVRRAVGDLDLDLGKLTRGGRDATVEASVGVGSLDVSLPRRTRVVVDARVGKGQINPFAVDADSTQGFDRRVVRRVRPRRGSSRIPTIHVRAAVGLGTIDLSGGSDLVAYRP